MPDFETTPSAATVMVLVCDDVPAFRALMRAVLEEDPRIEVVGEARDGLEVVPLVEALHPDVVLLDLAMPHSDGLQATPEIRRVSPATQVIGLSGFTAAGVAEQMLAAGASAYLEKGAELEEIVSTVLRVAAQDPPAPSAPAA